MTQNQQSDSIMTYFLINQAQFTTSFSKKSDLHSMTLKSGNNNFLSLGDVLIRLSSKHNINNNQKNSFGMKLTTLLMLIIHK